MKRNTEFRLGYKVFISYSTKDLAAVQHIRSAILTATPDVEVFVAEYSAHPGNSLPAQIEAGIRSCDLFVLLWSPDSENSEWVPQEIGLAKGCGRHILPIVLAPNMRLPGFISDLKYIEAFKHPVDSVAWLQNFVKTQSDATKQMNLLGLVGVVALIVLGINAK